MTDKKIIPGINSQPQTRFAVLKPFNASAAGAPEDLLFSRWLASTPLWAWLLMIACVTAWPAAGFAASTYTMGDAFQALYRWIPFIVTGGFFFNVLISFLAMLIGTIFGIVLGLMQISPAAFIRWPAQVITQVFRNSPWLVLLFIVLLALPYEIEFGETVIRIPDWVKAVFGLCLPIMANISEVVRGAINSVPSGQWEAAESMAYTRQQTLWQVILPQCFKRMIPPWMNWYAILTLATPLCSLLGVEEMLNLTRQAMESEGNQPALLIPFFGFVLVVFFAYCYPIARWTVSLEKKFAVKL